MKALLATLLILGVAFFGVALYQGWIVFEKDKSPDDKKTGVHITVDKDKAKEDLKAAGEKIKEAAGEVGDKFKDGASAAKEKVDKVFDGTTVTGEVMNVETVKKELTVKTADRTGTIVVDDSAVIRLGGETVNLGAIRTGDSVTAKLKDVDGRKVATEVNVTRK
jgi:hypothetical protein